MSSYDYEDDPVTANFDIDEFVHATGEGGIDPRPVYSDAGAIDVDALGQVAPRPATRS